MEKITSLNDMIQRTWNKVVGNPNNETNSILEKDKTLASMKQGTQDANAAKSSMLSLGEGDRSNNKSKRKPSLRVLHQARRALLSKDDGAQFALSDATTASHTSYTLAPRQHKYSVCSLDISNSSIVKQKRKTKSARVPNVQKRKGLLTSTGVDSQPASCKKANIANIEKAEKTVQKLISVMVRQKSSTADNLVPSLRDYEGVFGKNVLNEQLMNNNPKEQKIKKGKKEKEVKQEKQKIIKRKKTEAKKIPSTQVAQSTKEFKVIKTKVDSFKRGSKRKNLEELVAKRIKERTGNRVDRQTNAKPKTSETEKAISIQLESYIQLKKLIRSEVAKIRGTMAERPDEKLRLKPLLSRYLESKKDNTETTPVLTTTPIVKPVPIKPFLKQGKPKVEPQRDKTLRADIKEQMKEVFDESPLPSYTEASAEVLVQNVGKRPKAEEQRGGYKKPVDQWQIVKRLERAIQILGARSPESEVSGETPSFREQINQLMTNRPKVPTKTVRRIKFGNRNPRFNSSAPPLPPVEVKKKSSPQAMIELYQKDILGKKASDSNASQDFYEAEFKLENSNQESKTEKPDDYTYLQERGFKAGSVAAAILERILCHKRRIQMDINQAERKMTEALGSCQTISEHSLERPQLSEAALHYIRTTPMYRLVQDAFTQMSIAKLSVSTPMFGIRDPELLEYLEAAFPESKTDSQEIIKQKLMAADRARLPVTTFLEILKPQLLSTEDAMSVEELQDVSSLQPESPATHQATKIVDSSKSAHSISSHKSNRETLDEESTSRRQRNNNRHSRSPSNSCETRSETRKRVSLKSRESKIKSKIVDRTPRKSRSPSTKSDICEKTHKKSKTPSTESDASTSTSLESWTPVVKRDATTPRVSRSHIVKSDATTPRRSRSPDKSDWESKSPIVKSAATTLRDLRRSLEKSEVRIDSRHTLERSNSSKISQKSRSPSVNGDACIEYSEEKGSRSVVSTQDGTKVSSVSKGPDEDSLQQFGEALAASTSSTKKQSLKEPDQQQSTKKSVKFYSKTGEDNQLADSIIEYRRKILSEYAKMTSMEYKRQQWQTQGVDDTDDSSDDDVFTATATYNKKADKAETEELPQHAVSELYPNLSSLLAKAFPARPVVESREEQLGSNTKLHSQRLLEDENYNECFLFDSSRGSTGSTSDDSTVRVRRIMKKTDWVDQLNSPLTAKAKARKTCPKAPPPTPTTPKQHLDWRNIEEKSLQWYCSKRKTEKDWGKGLIDVELLDKAHSTERSRSQKDSSRKSSPTWKPTSSQISSRRFRSQPRQSCVQSQFNSSTSTEEESYVAPRRKPKSIKKTAKEENNKTKKEEKALDLTKNTLRGSSQTRNKLRSTTPQDSDQSTSSKFLRKLGKAKSNESSIKLDSKEEEKETSTTAIMAQSWNQAIKNIFQERDYLMSEETEPTQQQQQQGASGWDQWLDKSQGQEETSSDETPSKNNKNSMKQVKENIDKVMNRHKNEKKEMRPNLKPTLSYFSL